MHSKSSLPRSRVGHLINTREGGARPKYKKSPGLMREAPGRATRSSHRSLASGCTSKHKVNLPLWTRLIVRRLSLRIVRIGVVLLGEMRRCGRRACVSIRRNFKAYLYVRFSSLRGGKHKSNNDRQTPNTQQLCIGAVSQFLFSWCCWVTILAKNSESPTWEP